MAGEKIKKLEEEIGALETQYGGRTFSYDPDSDKGYQDYLKLMQDSGKKAMEDTVGKASALTGGYGNSYDATAGQQVYNDFVKQGAEAQASFRQLARDEFDAENQDILNRLGMLKEQKSSIWEDAARKAGFGDYSGYVGDLGLYGSVEEAEKAMSGVAEPTEAQIAYAKEAYKNGGEEMLDEYVGQLSGVNTDEIFASVLADEELAVTPEVLARRFSLADDGGPNFFWGLDNDAKFTLDVGTSRAETKTVKEWLKTLTKPVEDGGYGWSEDDAKEFLKDLQENLGA